MSDYLSKNIGNLFGNLSLEAPKEYLPPSLNKFISNNYYTKDTYFTTEEVVTGLNSGNANEVYVILKFLVRILTTQRSYNEVNQVFPHVIKNINSSSLKIRRLVYYILLHFSEQQPDISLLSINAIQKSLSDKDCVNRALAIRTLSGINVPAILPILVQSLKKTVKDSSPLVRSASAVSICKCYTLDRNYNGKAEPIGELLADTSSITAQLYDFLDMLLSDNDSRVVGSALEAFHTVFPNCFDLLHAKLSHFISKLNYLDEFSTALLLDVLTDYSKVFFLPIKDQNSLPQELQELLVNLKLLMFSSSGNVILAVSRCATALFPFAVGDLKLPTVLLNFTHGSAQSFGFNQDHQRELFLCEVSHLIDLGLMSVVKADLSHFVPLTDDTVAISKLKLDILCKLVDCDTFNFVFGELKFILANHSRQLTLRRYASQKLNRILLTKLSDQQMAQVARFFLDRLQLVGEGDEDSGEESLVGEGITGLRQLIQSDVVEYVDVLIQLASKLLSANGVSSLPAVAQASIIWLLGEFAISSPHNTDENTKANIGALQAYLPDLFRILAANFKTLESMVKLEVLQSLAKLVTSDIYMCRQAGQIYMPNGNPTFKVFNYVLQLTKYDHDVDIRDRSRLIGAVLPSVVYAGGDIRPAQLSVDKLLTDPQIAAVCEQKIDTVELAVFIFQTEKPKPSVEDSGRDVSEDSECLKRYHQVTQDTLDPAYIDYYNELRAQDFQLRDYSVSANSVSYRSGTTPRSASGSPVGTSGSVGTSEILHATTDLSWTPHPNVSKYKLQTLDDFLNDDEEDKK